MKGEVQKLIKDRPLRFKNEQSPFPYVWESIRTLTPSYATRTRFGKGKREGEREIVQAESFKSFLKVHVLQSCNLLKPLQFPNNAIDPA